MKVLRIISSEAARGARAVSLSSGKIYGVNLIRALEKRYGFFQSPKTLAELDAEMKFQHGFFDGSVVDLHILENGVRASSDGGTELCDRFIDDLVGWASSDAGITFEPFKDVRVYNSVLEIEMEGDFDSFFAPLKEIGEYIGERNGFYGGMNNAYKGVGLVMLGTLEGPAPSQFRIERRLNYPFESKVYFTSAPLPNTDHITLLERLEELIS